MENAVIQYQNVKRAITWQALPSSAPCRHHFSPVALADDGILERCVYCGDQKPG